MTFPLKSRDYLGEPSRKKYFNLQLFKEVAPKYDFITRALSLGLDRSWKRHLIEALPAVQQPRCVDLACGTGDLSFMLAERYADGEVLGLDLTPSMIDVARARNHHDLVSFTAGEMTRTSLPEASVDIVTGGYALRNAPDLDAALLEIHRILKPGGAAAFLDFSKPADPLLQRVTLAILKLWGGFWGLLLHRSPEVYVYIAESLRRYPNRIELRIKLHDMGFEQIQSRLFFPGFTELITFRKS